MDARNPSIETIQLGLADPASWSGYLPRGQGFDATLARFYERPVDDRALLQVWSYSDRLSYRPGDEVCIHSCSSVDQVELSIERDGLRPTPIASLATAKAPFAMPPADFIEKGCGWPVAARWRVPAGLPSGFYVLLSRAMDATGATREQEHGFFVLPERKGRAAAPILVVAATSTWAAYNDWGGQCTYVAHDHPNGYPIAPRVTLLRPYARGFIWLPRNAPRKSHGDLLGPDDIPRYQQLEFAFQRGYSRYYGNAGWASFERLFARWCEREGYAVDYATQHDLHFDPDILTGYPCVVLAGHDEYWSWEMREAIDRYIDGGGHVARFAGNFTFQVRLEDGGATQVCYGRMARSHDPLMGTERQRRVTTAWEDPLVGWPGAASLGLNGLWGVYAGWGTLASRGSRGFTVYRPEHWALAGTGLGYGDVLGGGARILGFETDGLDYVVKDGLPYPTHRDGAPETAEIIALGLTSNRETQSGRKGEVTYLPDETGAIALLRYGADTPENRRKASRGAGMIVSMTRGRGAVFNAGTMDWVVGLETRDPMVEIVTRNVLDRFTRT